jgi:hypothetical protein
MILGLPQLILLAIHLMLLGGHFFGKNGDVDDGIGCLIGTSLLQGLLYWGGWYGP